MRRDPPKLVTVNGVSKEMLPVLHYDQLVASAFGRAALGGYRVTWNLGDQRGELTPGVSIKTCDGMVFVVAKVAGAGAA